MQGKYGSWASFRATQGYRSLLRGVIRPLVAWQPLREPEEGYTLIIGCCRDLAEVLLGNLACLSRQRLEHLKEILLVFDCGPDELPGDFEQRVHQRFGDLPIRFIFYTPVQRRTCAIIRWGWLNAWLSWSLGLAQTRTRHAILHDFDAMLIDDDFIEARYRAIRDRGCAYLGVRNYNAKPNAIYEKDGLVVTFEMFCDAAFVRERFSPIDLFNHVTTFNGRTVDFDTFLYAQSQAGEAEVLPADKEQMVHPSQVICDFVRHRAGSSKLSQQRNSLMMIPYFMAAGGEPALMQQLTRQMREEGSPVDFFGRPLHVGQLTEKHAAWLAEQIHRLENALAGEVRRDAAAYCDALSQVGRRDQAEPATQAAAEQAST